MPRFPDGSARPALPVVAIGTYAFAWQIYGDFSGYSDIARGSAQLLGFHFMVNFRQPYLATSLQDFWRRWHISLSTWLRDYLYIPLGGSRDGERRTYRNLLLTMLIGGLVARRELDVRGLGRHPRRRLEHRAILPARARSNRTGDRRRSRPLERGCHASWCFTSCVWPGCSSGRVERRRGDDVSAAASASFAWLPEYGIAFRFLALFTLPLVLDRFGQRKSRRGVSARKRVPKCAASPLGRGDDGGGGFAGGESTQCLHLLPVLGCAAPRGCCWPAVLPWCSASKPPARLAFDRASKIQRRMVDEYRMARTIGIGPAGGRTHVLFVGNSLLDEDVRFDRLQDAVAPQWDARRFVVEQTFYYDWYYGLKRLFAEGARPDIVVLMLSTRQWVRTEMRGDYSAYYLLSTRDVADAARDLNLSATQTSSLAFANISKFWAARAEMRNFVIGHLMPDLGRLMELSARRIRIPSLTTRWSRLCPRA